jgi:prepilin-type N-terminal cleavage/methylation domain-containing protein
MSGPIRASLRGFTLVEILVAAAIVSLSVVSVVAFVRKGQEQIALDKHRRTARSIVERTIEDSQYDLYNYPNLVSGAVTRTDTIDGRYTPPLTGTLTVSVGDEQNLTAARGRAWLSFPIGAYP